MKVYDLNYEYYLMPSSWCEYDKLVYEREDAAKSEINLTDVERTILDNTNEDYEYITRDKDGDLWVHINEPYKSAGNYYDDEGDSCDMTAFNHLFEFVKAGECYKIEELLWN